MAKIKKNGRMAKKNNTWSIDMKNKKLKWSDDMV
jgi:hypothetical protein